MTNEKQYAESNINAHYNQSAQGGLLGQSARATLIDRVIRAQEKSRLEAERLQRFAELQYLLEKNPDIARILDLLEIDIRF